MTALEKIARLNEERYGLEFERRFALDKLSEELAEFADPKADLYETVDALADIIVIAAGELRKLGYCPEKVLHETITEISLRVQDPAQAERWANGDRRPGEKWEKDRNAAVPYKAEYRHAMCR